MSETAPAESADQPTLQQQVEMLQQQLAEARKFAALGELLSTTTHEFNNVLTTILNYAKLGLRHTDQPTRTKALEKILSAAQRAEKITNSVLGLARNRGNDPIPTDLAAIVSETLVLLERELMKYRVQLDLQLEPSPKVMAVGNQIQQVLLNLVTNARQAMPHGGQLLIRVAEDKQAKTVDLVVRDSGVGIPADQLPRIFGRFFTTKDGPDASGKGGTGVGLSMCKDIVDSHGGKIRVESTPGKGTAFTIKLPVAKQVDAASQPIAKLGLPVGA